MQKTLIGNTLIAVFFSIIAFSLKAIPFTENWIHNSFFVLLIGMYAISLLTGYISHKGTTASPDMAIGWFLGTNVLRILLCSVLVAALLFKGVGQRGVLILNFFLIYISLLIFEVWHMVQILNKKRD